MPGPRLRITILGCGSSGGVPRVGGDWGACDPRNPRNYRLRCALLVERIDAGGVTSVLVDAGPDLRAQCLRAGIQHLDAILVTHAHADHVHGLDDLRGLYLRNGRKPMALWTDAETAAVLQCRFAYAFREIPGTGYLPILRLHETDGPVRIDGDGGSVLVQPFRVPHGGIACSGFRFGPVAYTPDLSALPKEAQEVLAGVDTWIVDALQRNPHPTHTHLAQTLEWIAHINPRRAVLTNMHNDLDYETVAAETPEHVVPAYDNMVLEFDVGPPAVPPKENLP